MARVLVVDDDPVTSMILARTLGKAGHVVEVAGDGFEALDMLSDGDGDFALILTDFMMPRMSGQELYEKVRSDPRLAQLPILLTTGVIDPEKLRWLEQATRIELIPKPVELAGLLARIEEYTGA